MASKQGLTVVTTPHGKEVLDFAPIMWQALGDGSSVEGYLDRRFRRFFQAVRETCERNELDELFLFRIKRLAERIRTFDHTVRFGMDEVDSECWAKFIQEPYESRRHWLGGMILGLISTLVVAKSETTPVSQIHWRSSTASFIFVVRQLLRQGYLELPSEGGRSGDGNETELLRRLLLVFDVRGKDGSALSPEQLRQRMQGYENRPLAPAKAKKWVIPDAKEMK